MKSMKGVPFEAIRVGTVSSVDRKKGTAKVYFPDRDEAVSFDLPVIQKNTMNCKFYWMPEVDEQVICLYLANGQETGFVLGSFYSEADKPVSEISEEDTDRDGVWFKDGTFVKYEHDTKKLIVDCVGEVYIKAEGNVYIEGAEIHLNENK